MLDKKDIINFLYVASFPVYGIGSYVTATINSPIGHMVSISVHILIILFYTIDLLYKKQFQIKVNSLFFWMIAFQLSSVAAFFIALSKNPPFINELVSYTRSGIIIFPFFAFVAVCLYNEKQPERLVHLTFNSLSIMLLINVIGFYVFGLQNGIHSIEGRLSLPFIDGMYSGACLIAIINLMLYYYMKKAVAESDGFRFTYLLLYFLLNLLFLYFINSRLANMIFLVVFGLAFLNIIHRARGLFLAGVLFVPLLLNFGYVLYQILSLPVFKAIMQRVDLKDVTTFNGRSYAWTSALDWLMNDQRNIVFGNGHNGHYFLHLMTNIAKLWGVKETDTHLHSTSLSILVDQGIVGVALLTIVSLLTYGYFRKRLAEGKVEGIFFSVMVFIFIVMQVDMFVYRDCTGAIVLAALAAIACVNWKPSIK